MPSKTISRALPAFALPALALLAGCEDEPVNADTSYEESRPAPIETSFPEGEPVPDNEVDLDETDLGEGPNVGGGLVSADEVAQDVD